jgi:ribonuclease P protein component
LRAALFCFRISRFCDEAHVPAQPPCPRPPSRLSRPHGYAWWPQGAARPSCARPQETFGLSDPVPDRPASDRPIKPAVLTRRADFLAANRGLRIARPGFVLLARPNGGAGLRFGITVTKRIGNAVVRNRMKRRFRELLRGLLPEHGMADTDHVLIGREGGVERDFTKLRDELLAALGRARDGKGDPPRKRHGKGPPKR